MISGELKKALGWITGRKRPARVRLRDGDINACIDLAYRHYLGRAPDPSGRQAWPEALRSGMPLSECFKHIATSAEARNSSPGSKELFDRVSDGEFLLALAEWTQFGLAPRELVDWMRTLGENRTRRTQVMRQLLQQQIARGRQVGEDDWNPHECAIMGTSRLLTPAAWKKRAAELEREGGMSPRAAKPFASPLRHSGEYIVSAIASLYKGRRYLEAFLDNITGQTYFDRSELIVIDADSPEGEGEVIAEYQRRYPNIVYHRVNFRLGIYEAWNVAVGLARGKYLTNTNLDDLRRHDSFELQARALDRHPEVDIVYQDFYYSLDQSLSFDQIAQFGFKSDVPPITPHSLLQFNSPHNGPMWRKSLHDELGLFDAELRSAGDWEFWLRCLSCGKQFRKIATPHIAYFQNPEGISTRPETRGFNEGRQVVRRYLRKLISPYLLMSGREFAEMLGTDIEPAPGEYYELAERELIKLGSRSRPERSALQS